MTKTKLQKVREMCTTKNFLIFSIVAIVVFSFMFMMTVPIFAQADSNGTLNQIVGTVVGIVKTAALYIGIIVVIWGVFQIILAMRREDSEGISKQVTTIVIGSLLVAFGAFINKILSALGVGINVN